MNAGQLTEAEQPNTKRLRARTPAVRSADVLVRSEHTEECRPEKPAGAAESDLSGCFEYRPVRGPGLQGFRILAISRRPRALTRRPPTILNHALRAHLSSCALASPFSLTPCVSWGLGDVLARQPFQRLSADGKPLKAVARIRPPAPTLLKQAVNESAADNAHQTS